MGPPVSGRLILGCAEGVVGASMHPSALRSHLPRHPNERSWPYLDVIRGTAVGFCVAFFLRALFCHLPLAPKRVPTHDREPATGHDLPRGLNPTQSQAGAGFSVSVSRFSVFAISIPRLRTHAGAVASSRLRRRDFYSSCFSSALHTGLIRCSVPHIHRGSNTLPWARTRACRGVQGR